jgi:hypothetical protein
MNSPRFLVGRLCGSEITGRIMKNISHPSIFRVESKKKKKEGERERESRREASLLALLFKREDGGDM